VSQSVPTSSWQRKKQLKALDGLFSINTAAVAKLAVAEKNSRWSSEFDKSAMHFGVCPRGESSLI
jgi:hypothetical protein